MTDPVNLRDVRGLRTDDGRIVRRGALYRSEAPRTPANPSDVPVWPPAHVIDLRAPEERTWAHPLDGLATVHLVPLGRTLAPALAEQTDEPDLAWAYRLLAKEAADEIAGIIGLVAQSPGPVLVHCTAGKDRTGIVVALALLAVGVDRDAVVEDYARTEGNLAGEWLEDMVTMIGRYGVPDTPELRVLMGGSPREALEGVIETLDRAHGSTREYLLASGLTLHELAALEALLIDQG